MSYRILTEAEFEAFAAAERKLYGEVGGMLAWSDVRERTDSAALAALWDDAISGLELLDETPEDEEATRREAARRVAVAQYYVLLGEVPSTVA